MPRFHERDGVTLAFDAAGSGDPAMVFVHGWLCDRSHFAPQLEHFAARHAVVGVDLPGHGDSGQSTPESPRYLVDSFAEDVLAVASAAGCKRPVVVGHSLGAAVALACVRVPDAVRAVVMIDCTPILDPAAKSFLISALPAIESDADAAYRRQFFAGMFLPTDTVRRDAIIDAAGAVPAPIATAAIRGLIAFDGAAAFAAATVPVLWIRSGLPGDSPESVQDACPTVTIGQTVGAGHFIQLEVPEQVNHMIERFLAVNDI